MEKIGDCWYDVEVDPSDGNQKLRTKALHLDGVTTKVDQNFPIITLGNINDPSKKWFFSDFYAIVRVEDEYIDMEKDPNRDNFPWPPVPAGWNNLSIPMPPLVILRRLAFLLMGIIIVLPEGGLIIKNL